jgi:uncharacterized protein YlaI
MSLQKRPFATIEKPMKLDSTALHLFHCAECAHVISSRSYQRAATWLEHHMLVVHRSPQMTGQAA